MRSFDVSGYLIDESDLDRLLTPFLAVYPEKVTANLRRMKDYLAGDVDCWRPHVKTSKIPEVFARLVRFGLRAFKCATTREADRLARVLVEDGARGGDILVAYPLTGPALRRLAAIARAWPSVTFSVVCEDPAAVAAVPAEIGIFIDLNCGMNRTGIPLDETAAIRAVARAAGERLRGLHAYEGQIASGDYETRRKAAWRGYDRVVRLARELSGAGHRVGEIITSGTPSFRPALAYGGWSEIGCRHRISPGTVVYHDLRSAEELEEVEFEPAALVVSRVVSHPAPSRLTCDAGSKAVAAEAGDPVAAVLGWPGLVAECPSEEHLPLRVLSGERPRRGEPLWLFPRHVCPTVNLAEEAVLVADGRVRERVVVSARAHDLWADA